MCGPSWLLTTSPLTPLINCQWSDPNSCGFTVGFSVSPLSRVTVSSAPSFHIYLSYWFIPWHSELRKVNSPLSCVAFARWTASLALQFTTFDGVGAACLIVVSLLVLTRALNVHVWCPQWGGEEISEAASCDTLLRQHGTLSLFPWW